jgi:hypothetical protein
MVVYNKSVMSGWKETTKTFTRKKKNRDCLWERSRMVWKIMRDIHKNKMCILNLYFPFSSPRLNDVRLVYNKSNQTITQMTTWIF